MYIAAYPIQTFFCGLRKARPFRPSWLLILFLLLVSTTLHAAIILETQETEVFFRVEAISELPVFSLSVPVCRLAISAKHRGPGKVLVSYTPLGEDREMIFYQLVRENGGNIDARCCFEYRVGGTSLEYVDFGVLTAKFSRMYSRSDRESCSQISFNIILEQ